MCWRTVEAYVRASASWPHVRSETAWPLGSRISTRQARPFSRSTFTVYRFSSGIASGPMRRLGRAQPLQERLRPPQYRFLVENERGLHARDLLQGPLQGVAGHLGLLERLGEHGGVVRLEGQPIPGAMALRVEDLLHQEVTAAPSTRP